MPVAVSSRSPALTERTRTSGGVPSARCSFHAVLGNSSRKSISRSALECYGLAERVAVGASPLRLTKLPTEAALGLSLLRCGPHSSHTALTHSMPAQTTPSGPSLRALPALSALPPRRRSTRRRQKEITRVERQPRRRGLQPAGKCTSPPSHIEQAARRGTAAAGL